MIDDLEHPEHNLGDPRETPEEKEIENLKIRLEHSKKLYDMTLTNELRWMRKHEEVSQELKSLKDKLKELCK